MSQTVEKSTASPSVVTRGLVWPVTHGKDHKPVIRQAANVARFLEHRRVHARRNVFTGTTEANGEPLTDLGFKQMWLSACSLGLQDDLRTFCTLVDVVAAGDSYHP